MKTKPTGWQLARELFAVVSLSLVFLGVLALLYYAFFYLAPPILLVVVAALSGLEAEINALSRIEQEILSLFIFLFFGIVPYLRAIAARLQDLVSVERERQRQQHERKFQDILSAIYGVHHEISLARGVPDALSPDPWHGTTMDAAERIRRAFGRP